MRRNPIINFLREYGPFLLLGAVLGLPLAYLTHRLTTNRALEKEIAELKENVAAKAEAIENIKARYAATDDQLKRLEKYPSEQIVCLAIEDQDGSSVTQAVADVTLYMADRSAIRETQTATNGVCLFRATTPLAIAYTITHGSYYTTKGHQAFNGTPLNYYDPALLYGRKLTLQLKKKNTPVPHYAKHVRVELPDNNRPVGFDLQAGDLVAPYGKGSIADLTLCYHTDTTPEPQEVTSNTLTFAVAHGGFQTQSGDTWSELRTSSRAPSGGYTPNWTLTRIWQSEKLTKDDYLPTASYIAFCVPARETSADGSLNYGKIYGPISYANALGDASGGVVNFTYYYNPAPGDRTIEFAPSANLLKDGYRTRISEP